MKIKTMVLGALLSVPIVLADEITGGRLVVSALVVGMGYAAVPIMIAVTHRSYMGWKNSNEDTIKYLTFSFGLLTIGIILHGLHNMIMLPVTEVLSKVPTSYHYILTGSGEVFLFLSALMFLKSMRAPA